ncbi:Ribonuclease H-like domain [Phytophthora cactorum]|nr:Ribonuclease H-like domain [Phytophthora cactorum]
MPLSEVDNELTRSMSRWGAVSSRVLLKSMHYIAKVVGVNLEVIVGICFGIMFDGWSNCSMHYVAVFGVFEADGVFHIQLLAVSPLQDGPQGADAHTKLFDGVLDVYNKKLDMVAFVIGDNCSTNQSIATKLGVPLVGCASHRFKLAVNRYISEYESLLTKVNNLMPKLCQVNNFAVLAKSTDLHPIKRNTTRWSSSFEILQRVHRIRHLIETVEVVEELVPT